MWKYGGIIGNNSGKLVTVGGNMVNSKVYPISPSNSQNLEEKKTYEGWNIAEVVVYKFANKASEVSEKNFNHTTLEKLFTHAGNSYCNKCSTLVAGTYIKINSVINSCVRVSFFTLNFNPHSRLIYRASFSCKWSLRVAKKRH